MHLDARSWLLALRKSKSQEHIESTGSTLCSLSLQDSGPNTSLNNTCKCTLWHHGEKPKMPQPFLDPKRFRIMLGNGVSARLLKVVEDQMPQ